MNTAAARRPFITIIITSYNYGEYIGTAIESALSQKYPHFEVLVVDNASTDNSSAIIASYAADPRFRAIHHPHNIGRTANHNFAARESRGELIVFLSADDFLLPGHLDTLQRFMADHPDLDLAYANVYEADSNGRPIQISVMPGHVDVRSYVDGRNELAEMLTFGSYMWLPTMLFSRALFLDIGGFDETIEVAADYDLQLRLIGAGMRIGFLNRPLACIRHHSTNASISDYVSSGKNAREFISIYDRIIASAGLDNLQGREAGVERLLGSLLQHIKSPEDETRVRVDLADTIFHLRQQLNNSASKALGAAPLVSVIVPTTGRVAYLTDALRSLQSQTYQNWEAIVIDDSPIDASGIIDALRGETRIRYVRHMRQRGLAAARNTGLRLASGTIIAYLDETDIAHERHLELLVAPLCNGSDVATTRASFVLEKQQLGRDATRQVIANTLLCHPAQAWEQIFSSPFLGLSALAHSRRCIDRTGGFRDSLALLDGWDFAIRAGSGVNIAAIDAATVQVRRDAAFADIQSSIRLEQLPALVSAVHALHSSSDMTLASSRLATIERISNAIFQIRAAPDDISAYLAVFGSGNSTVPSTPFQ